MNRIAILALGFSTGCVVNIDDNDGPPYDGTNSAPIVEWGAGGCYWDGYYYDDIWWFEADVSDYDGLADVSVVYADVYDRATGYWVDSFELYPTSSAATWFSDWLGASTYLDCGYGGYEVDLVAYDVFDAFGAITIIPDTYNLY